MPTKHGNIQVVLPATQMGQLKAQAQAQGISSGELIRRLLIAAAIITDPDIHHGGNRHK